MNEPMIVASARDQGSRASAGSEDSTQAWLLLGWIGFAFLTVGGVDFALAWFPLGFGNQEWWFGTVSQTFNGLPILLLGLGLLTAAAEQVERRWWALVGGGAAVVMLVWMLVAAVMWATTVQVALATVPGELALGVNRAIAKTLVQSVAYSTVLIYMVRRIWLGSWRAAKPEAG